MTTHEALPGRMARPDFTIDIRSADLGFRVGSWLDHVICVRLRESGRSGLERVDIVPASFSYEWQAGQPARLLLFTFTKAFTQRVARSMGVTMPAKFVAPLLGVRDRRIFHVASALIQATITGVSNPDAVINGLARAIVAQFVRRCSRREFRAKLEDRRLADVLRHIDENLDHNLGIVELAAVGNITSQGLRMLMRHRLGISPHQYVLRRRTEHAIRMLCEGQSSLGEVARLCGFANQSHMARIVRAVAGVTPRTIRK